MIASIFLVQYDTYNYIENRICEYEKQIETYQEQINSYAKCINLYRREVLNLKDELSGVKEDLSNAKKDIFHLKNNTSHNMDNNRVYIGRLYIPAANINVALYNGWSQAITDMQDSANYFSFVLYSRHRIIADHNIQEFSKLFNVEVGTTGYIEFNDGTVENIKCVEVLNGHNKETDLTDENGNSVWEKEDYLMYTCRDGWRNIFISLWTII